MCFEPNVSSVCSARYTYNRGFFGGSIEPTKVSGTGIEFVPNVAGVFGRVFRSYPSIPNLAEGFGRIFTEQPPQPGIV